MERFTVRITVNKKEYDYKFEHMKYAKRFAQRSVNLKGNETSFVEIIDNKVNQTPYSHYQVNGIVRVSNLMKG